MKKSIRIVAVILVYVLLVAFVGCSKSGSNMETNSVTTQPTETSDAKRETHFKLNPEVQKYINPDDTYINLLDDLYVAAESAFRERSFDDRIYDAAIALSDKETKTISERTKTDEEFKKWYFEANVFDKTFGISKIVIAGYEKSLGELSEKEAFCKMLHAADSVLDFYYADYQPVFALQEYVASKITADYDSNELAADSKYKGKMIRVNGYVKEITKDVFDNYYISIGENNPYSDEVRCYFDDSYANRIATMSKGEYVSLTICIDEKDILDVNATLWEISEETAE